MASSGQRLLLFGAETEFGMVTLPLLTAAGYQVCAAVHGQLEATQEQELRRSRAEIIETDRTQTHQVTDVLRQAHPDIVIDLAYQQANTLLHDGHLFRPLEKAVPVMTATLCEAMAAQRIPRFLYASMAFLYGNVYEASEQSPLQPPARDPAFIALVHAEQAVTRGMTPATILRFGYLYGPRSHDLKLYERSFRLHRPFFAGPETTRGCWVQMEDAARAIVAALARGRTQTIYNIVDREPVNFGTFIDHFAQLLGHGRPPHIPVQAAPIAQIVIKKPQMELLGTTTTVRAELAHQILDWQPRFPSYRDGLADVVARLKESKQKSRMLP